jgi:hypothetical protein
MLQNVSKNASKYLKTLQNFSENTKKSIQKSPIKNPNQIGATSTINQVTKKKRSKFLSEIYITIQ